MTVSELLVTPFQPVEVLRKLGRYGRMLDLQPAISTVPDPEFIVRLLTGCASHQAYIRRGAGLQYKNLENLVRGKHKVSPTTKHMLVICLGFSMENLEKLEGSAPDGPLIPEVLALFQIVEGLPRRVTSGLLERAVPCACCGKNLLDDVNAWWSTHAPRMRSAEYDFAERLLNALLGAALIERVIGLFQEHAELSLNHLNALANPSRHPIGNWLSEAQEAMSCDSLAKFAVAMQRRGIVGAMCSHGRLKKWSAGQDVMPLEAGEAIADACGQAKIRMRRLIAARTIALVTDFVAASLPTDGNVGSRKAAQEIVHARLMQLGSNLEIAIAATAGKLPQRFLPSDEIAMALR